MATEHVEFKHFAGFEIKDADKGEVEAVIATLDVVDLDGDIIRPSAIPDGAKVAMSSYGHDAVFGNRPIGKGVLSVDGKKLKFAGRIFLKTGAGRETFEVLKEMGADQEWSFGFHTLGSEVPEDGDKKQGALRVITKLDPFEVSPVLIGAGIGTRTVAVKSAQGTPGAEEPTAVAPPPGLSPADQAIADLAKAQAAAKLLAEEKSRLTAASEREFDVFQRTLRRHGLA